jgi:hypothetical protein
MAVGKLPGFLKKKKLLDDPQLPPAVCREYGDLFLEHGWLADALEFYLKGNVAEGLAQLHKLAVASGDAFILERLQQAQGPLAPEAWQQAAAAAAAAGQEALAQWARERSGEAGGAATGGAGKGGNHAHDA